MERVAFLLEPGGERLGCLLNPETVVVRRTAGVRSRRSLGNTVAGAGLSDDPLLYTGGGVTELTLELLFDLSVAGSSVQAEDVRDLTRPIWELAENRVDTAGYAAPPHVRFVWGKAWNFPAVVAAVAERLEQFSTGGAPRRSWLSLRLVRLADAPRPPASPLANTSSEDLVTAARETPEEELISHEVVGDGTTDPGDPDAPDTGPVRYDEIAWLYLGDPSAWRAILVLSGIVDPLRIPAGTVLRVPPPDALGRRP